ncbi:hypothetical protein [Aliikangiella sp. IMCC44359]|uniref:hypothetical protein n=1 Tax=Aliikangiella sp. IMCC44359 TaxID=3459125 RepID=UPI00403A969A
MLYLSKETVANKRLQINGVSSLVTDRVGVFDEAMRCKNWQAWKNSREISWCIIKGGKCMIKREVLMPVELVEEISQIVHKEGYRALTEAFPNTDVKPPIFLSNEEAEALISLAIIEKEKAGLMYPYYDDEHPRYSEEHEERFDDIQMGIYEKTIYYVESAFKKGQFDHLI